MITVEEYSKQPYFSPSRELQKLFKFKVALMRTRDSSIAEQSNWRSFIKQLGGKENERPACYEVVRFGHWACGWLEILIVNPRNQKLMEKAEQMLAKLKEHPILDEDDYAMFHYEECCDYWNGCSIQERIRYCKESGASILQARKEFSELTNDDLKMRIMDLVN